MFSDELLSLRVQRANPARADLLRVHARTLVDSYRSNEGSVARSVRGAVVDLLPDRLLTLAGAARKLRLSTRSLQRKLLQEGTSFHALVDQVRCELAKRYLRDPDLRPEQVFDQLAFSDESAFRRAFKRWTGETPAAFRSASMARWTRP